MAGDIKVVVLDSLEQMTTYVLEEQHDWFEDEIRFVRTLLNPGDSVIDIGANLGVYALSMARVVGRRGRVTAFEPASRTAAMLRASALLNGFPQLEVEQKGVAACSGEARLAVGDHSELNQLSNDADGEGGETVSLTSLDDWLEAKHDLEPIAFVKIDAEGQELNILHGARRFLNEQDPLILYEIRHGADLHLELVEAFAAHGYQSYRLLPGPQLLEPFDATAAVDGFLLNLFCCKPATARRLARLGHLLEAPPGPVDAALSPAAQPACVAAFWPGEEHDWPRSLAGCAHAARLRELWLAHQTPTSDPDTGSREALALHAFSMDPRQAGAARAAALHRSVALLRSTCCAWGSPVHLASLARAAAAAGERVLAVEALESLIGALPWMQDEDLKEPFLAPLARYDKVAPQGSLHDWLMMAAIEAHELQRHFSSYFTAPLQRERIDYALSLGYPSETLERRLMLLNRRFPPA